MQMLSELVKLSCPSSLNWHSFMIAKNIQSPKILFPCEKKINNKNATHNIGYIYSNERKKGIQIGHAEISSTRKMSTGRASRQNKPSAQIYNS